MKQWQPHLDLRRLLDALGEELLAATEQEVRQAYAETGRSISAAARDVRTLIAVMDGDGDELDAGFAPAEAARRREHWARPN